MRFLLCLLSFCFLCSCNTPVMQGLESVKELQSFFRSDHVNIKIGNHVAHITIEKSKLLEERANTPDSEKRAVLEQFSSLGTLIAYRSLAANYPLDSINITLKSSIGDATYSYPAKSLRDVDDNSKIVTSFLKSLNSNDYSKSSIFFSNDITGKLSKEDFYDFLEKSFLSGRIKNVKLVGFVAAGGQYGLYENVFFENETKQTYVFVFWENEKKIAGINHMK